MNASIMKIATLQHLLSGLLICCSACAQTSAEQTEDSKKVALAGNQGKFVAAVTPVEQIIFGVFCGECSHNCATMYSYHVGGNANMLWADYTDSYFRKGVDKMIFKTQITDLKKIALANDIIKHIPESLLLGDNATQTFGCPDCTDGCGIYFEIIQHNEDTNERKIKKLYIDYAIVKLNGEVKEFAEYLKGVIKKFNDEKH